MNLIIANTFQSALSNLSNAEQKAVKLTVFDLHQNLSRPSLRFHKISNTKDTNFWSIRVNRDIRLIVHKSRLSILIVYVDHHDKAYKWAESRRVDVHPSTGVAQIVKMREVSTETQFSQGSTDITISPSEGEITSDIDEDLPLSNLSSQQILDVGVPEIWVDQIRNATEDEFLQIADHLPEEASEALLEYVATGELKITHQETVSTFGSFEHPDAKRRFRLVHDDEDLERMLDYPWEKWTIYLHPTQQELVKRDYSGPARITGSAGTGKTVVALHRTAHILQSDVTAQVLLTTFSSTLANALEYKLKLILGNDWVKRDRVSVLPFQKVAEELFTLIEGRRPVIANRKQVEESLTQAKEESNLQDFSLRFLMSEWRFVVDAWQVDCIESYAKVPRIGRKKRLGNKQREILWPVFKRAKSILLDKQIITSAMAFGKVANYYANLESKPYTHIIVDEAQDLGVAELKMIRAIAPVTPSALLFLSDLGQRIFQETFSWRKLGVEILGRSHSLRVNYRTSHQIRETVDKLHSYETQDLDGVSQIRKGTVSTFSGQEPTILIFVNKDQEIEAVANFISSAISRGIPPDEIGIFVRSVNELERARKAVSMSDQYWIELSSRIVERNGRVSIGLMEYSKGLEFRKVFVMACDENVIPNLEELAYVSDESGLDELHDTERNLFYVACTRARNELTVTGISPGSELIVDLKSNY